MGNAARAAFGVVITGVLLSSPVTPAVCVAGATAADTPTSPTYIPPVLPEVPRLARLSQSFSESFPSFPTLYEASKDSAFTDWLLGIRRALHSWPETAYTEHRTSALVQGLLKVSSRALSSSNASLSMKVQERRRTPRCGSHCVLAGQGRGEDMVLQVRLMIRTQAEVCVVTGKPPLLLQHAFAYLPPLIVSCVATVGCARCSTHTYSSIHPFARPSLSCLLCRNWASASRRVGVSIQLG